MKGFALVLLPFLLVACGQSEHDISTDSARADSLTTDTSVQATSIPVFSDTSVFPAGYVIMDSVYGDLNLDPYPDAVLVLCHASEVNGATHSERPRALMIFLGDSTGHLNPEVRNDHIVLPEVAGQMFGEAYENMEIDSGTLRVNHYGGSRFRWTTDYVFEYDARRKTWFYTRSYATMGDMLGEMNELTEQGDCIPYAYDTLILNRPIDIRRFDDNVPVASAYE